MEWSQTTTASQASASKPARACAKLARASSRAACRPACTTHRPATIQRIRIGCGKDGRITAIAHESASGDLPGGGPETAVSQTKLLYAGAMFHDRGLQPKVRHRTTSYEVVRTLVGRGLITEAFTDPETGAINYRTTDALLGPAPARDLGRPSSDPGRSNRPCARR